MLRTKTRFAQFLAVLLLGLSVGTANATLIDNGDTTIDTSTGLEWLDLTLTTGQSWNAVVGGFGGYVNDGFRHANTQELCSLFTTLGDVLPNCTSDTNIGDPMNQANANLLVSLLGDTFGPNFGSIFTSCGIYDSGYTTSTGRVGLASVQATPNNGGCNTGFAPSAATLAQWTSLSGTNTLVGHWLVRAASPVPAPAPLAILTLALLALRARRSA